MRLEHLLSGATSDLTDSQEKIRVGSWSYASIRTSCAASNCLLKYKRKEEAEPKGEGLTDSPIAQLVRALH